MDLTYFNWSSGKDSALALFQIQNEKSFHISKLVTTVNSEYDRVSMHGLRNELLDNQARALGIPLKKIELPGDVSMSEYDSKMKEEIQSLKLEGYTRCIFGDIFLEDLRLYREEKLAEVGVKAIFPLWKRDTKKLIKEFVDLGFKAITVCVNAKHLDESFCGRLIDDDFINELPDNVDPCGENGEFHTFVFDGPIFKYPINFTIGEKVLRSYKPSKKKDDNCFNDDEATNWDNSFWYCDLLP